MCQKPNMYNSLLDFAKLERVEHRKAWLSMRTWELIVCFPLKNHLKGEMLTLILSSESLALIIFFFITWPVP